MRRWYVFLYAAASLALAQQNLPEMASSSRWGDDQIFQFRAPAPTRKYTVYGLTRPTANPAVTLKPLDQGRRVVNTASQQVTLSTAQEARATQDYTAQQVAYLDLTFTVNNVQKGSFYRNGQPILTKSGSNYDNLLWGTLWTVTFGLVSLFWLPSTSQTLHYTEIIPLDSPSIHYTFDGGGDCFSLGPGPSAGFWIDPSRLQPGYVYPMYATVSCYAPVGGIMVGFGLEASLPGVQWVRQGLPSYAYAQNGFQLYRGNPNVAPGESAWEYSPSGNEYALYSGYTLPDNQHPHLPTSLPLRGYQVDRMWTTAESAPTQIKRFVAPFNDVQLCLEQESEVCSKNATYRRVSANPPGPVTLTPQWGFPATSVGQTVSTGPNGEQVSQPYVQYSTSSPLSITLTDTFQCISGSCP